MEISFGCELHVKLWILRTYDMLHLEKVVWHLDLLKNLVHSTRCPFEPIFLPKSNKAQLVPLSFWIGLPLQKKGRWSGFGQSWRKPEDQRIMILLQKIDIFCLWIRWRMTSIKKSHLDRLNLLQLCILMRKMCRNFLTPNLWYKPLRFLICSAVDILLWSQLQPWVILVKQLDIEV